MGNGFGEKLRAERLERGLTQAELGRDLYSPSYISLLETGRREPTADVIEELARRLELAPKALEAWSQPVSVSDAEYVLAGLYARQAWDLRDYPVAATHAAAAVRLSSGIIEPETLSSIERAELALSIVGGNKTDQLEVAFIRARWLYLTGDIVAAVQKLREIHAEREALARHTAGEVSLLLGKALKAAGEAAEALVYLEEAQKEFSAAGASDRVQQALDAVLEIKLAQRRAEAASAEA